MRPIHLNDHEATIVLLALDITEQSWELHRLMGWVKAQPPNTKEAIEAIRFKIGAAGTPAWDGRANPGPEDDDGFISGSARG